MGYIGDKSTNRTHLENSTKVSSTQKNNIKKIPIVNALHNQKSVHHPIVKMDVHLVLVFRSERRSSSRRNIATPIIRILLRPRPATVPPLHSIPPRPTTVSPLHPIPPTILTPLTRSPRRRRRLLLLLLLLLFRLIHINIVHRSVRVLPLMSRPRRSLLRRGPA